MNKDFKFLGLSFNTKQTIFTLLISIGILCLLIGINALGVTVSWYGVIIAIAFLIALVLSTKLMTFRNLDSELPYDLIWWIFPSSIIGARTYYVIFEQVPFFWDAFKVWNGGMAIYGGIIGGAIGLIICCLIKKVNILKAMDVVAPVLILGQGIGRIGCYMAGCCVGNEITSKTLQWFPIAYYVHGGWHLATFFYECVFDIIGFFILVKLLKKYKQTGLIASVYLIYYGILRFILENFRQVDHDNALLISGTNIKISMVVSCVCIVLGVFGICYILIKKIRGNNENQTANSNQN